MTPRAWLLAVLWLVIAVFVWNALFDLYVSRGAREYLQLLAESELGRISRPDMTQVMDQAKNMGIQGASIWAAIILASGWATIAMGRRGN